LQAIACAVKLTGPLQGGASLGIKIKTYDGGGHVALVRHVISFVGSCKRYEIFEDYMNCALFTCMLQGNLMHWCATLVEKSIHSLSHLVVEIYHAFIHFDHKALNKEILTLRKAPDESIEEFHTCSFNLA